MSLKVEPGFMAELRRYGAFDVSACFNCGNCTAVCPLSKEKASFPRRMVRYAQLGAARELSSSPEPWLCYYCGECSQTCPRQANPGELMMSLRRWLIAEYDATGVSGLFYRRGWLQWLLAGSLLWTLLAVFGRFTGDFGALAARIESFFPLYVTLAIAGYAFNMYRSTVARPLGKRALSLKPRHLLEALKHGLTQPGFGSCSEADRWRWASHLLVMMGYTLTLLVANLRLLEPLGRAYAPFEPLSLLVWASGLSIVAGGGSMVLRRLLGRAESSRFSRPSDWLFVLTLFLMGASTLAVLGANVAQGPASPLLGRLYRLHIALEATWIALVVPFTKWIHIFFRPMAVYFGRVREEAEAGTALVF